MNNPNQDIVADRVFAYLSKATPDFPAVGWTKLQTIYATVPGTEEPKNAPPYQKFWFRQDDTRFERYWGSYNNKMIRLRLSPNPYPLELTRDAWFRIVLATAKCQRTHVGSTLANIAAFNGTSVSSVLSYLNPLTKQNLITVSGDLYQVNIQADQEFWLWEKGKLLRGGLTTLNRELGLPDGNSAGEKDPTSHKSLILEALQAINSSLESIEAIRRHLESLAVSKVKLEEQKERLTRLLE